MDIKKLIKKEKLKQWKVAEEIGITEFTFSRWLRSPEKLNKEQKMEIEAAIKTLIKAKEEDQQWQIKIN